MEHKHYLLSTGRYGTTEYTRFCWGKPTFTPFSPVRTPADILTSVDVEATNIKEIRLVWDGCHVVQYTFPPGTHAVENLRLLGLDHELPRYRIKYNDVYLSILADSAPKVVEHARAPTKTELASPCWKADLLQSSANFQHVTCIQVDEHGLSGFQLGR